MKISPRYDGSPLVRLDGPPAAVGVPFLRQRRRFTDALSSLSAAQWAAPTRCDEWRVQDVAAHLATVDRFFKLAIEAGLSGTPTRFLAGFDPKVTPASLVDAERDKSAAQNVQAFVDGSDALCATVESLDDEGWTAIAESPVGHVTISALVHHSLWDAWIHERDVFLPLGVVPDQEADEIVATLRYVAALGPAFALQSSSGHTGTLALEVERPAARIVVTVRDDVHVTEGDAPDGAVVLRGDAVDLAEALSVRSPLRQSVPDDQAWLVAGLATVFDSSLA